MADKQVEDSPAKTVEEKPVASSTYETPAEREAIPQTAPAAVPAPVAETSTSAEPATAPALAQTSAESSTPAAETTALLPPQHWVDAGVWHPPTILCNRCLC